MLKLALCHYLNHTFCVHYVFLPFQVKAIEELATAKKKVEEWRIKLGYAREQVVIWKAKVDRTCIERLRSFTNPSLLVVQVYSIQKLLDELF